MWASPQRPFGTISHDVVAPALILAWFGWLAHTLNKVAISSFNEFRTALGDPEAEEAYRSALTTVRDRNALLASAAALVVVSSFYYLAVRPFRDSMPIEIELASAPLWGLASVALGIVVLHTITQLRLVSRLSAVARNVDIFKPAPINAFSRLTAVSAMGLIAFVVMFVLFSPDQPFAYILQESVVLVIAAASFVLPLRVMHKRLAAEKSRLQGEAQERLKAVLARIHSAVDDGNLAGVEQLNNALTAVLAERDVLARLHTWPWSSGTIRGFVSALVVPIALIVFTQFIARLI